jgi:hypothetical protein
MRRRMTGNTSLNASWKNLLAAPARASHILQIYDSDAFLTAAVAHFAAEGLSRGEAVLLTGTRPHLAETERRLRALDIDVQAAAQSGQLVRADVEQALRELDTRRFEAQADETLGRLAQFPGVRWWGEITSTLLQHGEREAGLRAERVADAAAKKHGVAVFCPFLGDRFDARRYDAVLKDLCCIHSHVIPAEDYVAHRLAVNRAIADVLGDIRGTLLQSLASWKGLPCELPSSQALLFWVRETLPEHFEAVLERARLYHSSGEEACA